MKKIFFNVTQKKRVWHTFLHRLIYKFSLSKHKIHLNHKGLLISQKNGHEDNEKNIL